MDVPEAIFLTDSHGLLFVCATCQRPLAASDLIGQSLRLPDHQETRDDYLDAELLDDLSHMNCANARRSA